MAMFENWRQDNRIPLALLALIGLCLIIYVYDLAVDFYIPEPSLPMPMSTTRIIPIVQISQFHVFGVYDDTLQNLPETQLQLTLQGIMLSIHRQGQSYAIIESPSVPAKAYKVGDTIPGDATLKRIMKNQVVISYQGVMQSLKLPTDQLTLDNSSK